MARLGNVIESSALTGVPLTLDDATRLGLQAQAQSGLEANEAMAEQLRLLTAAFLAQAQANAATVETPADEVKATPVKATAAKGATKEV